MRKMPVPASRRSIARPDRTARRTSALPWWQRRRPRRRGLPYTPSQLGLRSQARIDRKLLTTDQSRRNTCLNHTLKDPAKNVVVTEPLIAGPRERRMVRNLVFDAQAAKPAVRQIDPDLATEQTLRPQAEGIAEDQHPDHQNWIDRGAAERRIMRRKLAIDPRQIEHRCNRAHFVIVGHHLFKAERIKQLLLIPLQPTHHGPFPPLTASTSENHCSQKPSTDFCNKICHNRKSPLLTRSPRRRGRRVMPITRCRA